VLPLELLSDTRHRLRYRPDYVLCDAWYPSRSGFATMDGILYDVSRKIAGSMDTRGGTIGSTLTWLSGAG
jgi:hypothetical protein